MRLPFYPSLTRPANPQHTHCADEAHERSLQTDILFGLIRRAQRERPELRVVVMSATLEVELFRGFFDAAPTKQGNKGSEESSPSPVAVVRVEGRQFPVDVFFCEEAQDDVIDSAFLAILQVRSVSQ